MSRRHHDRAVRILVDVHNITFYLRDLGGRQITKAFVGLGFDGIETLGLLARKRFPGEQILISSTVMVMALTQALDSYMLQHKLPEVYDARSAREWVAKFREKTDTTLKVIGYVTIDEYDAIRAIFDAREIEALPAYLASLAQVKAT